MDTGYLSSLLRTLQFEAGDITPVRSFDDARKLTLRLGVYDVFLLERLAVHLGVKPIDLAVQLLGAALAETADALADEVHGFTLDVDGDRYMDAWRAMKLAQEHFNGILSGWRSQRAVVLEGVFTQSVEVLRAGHADEEEPQE